MLRTVLLAIAALSLATPALADTIHCESPGKTALIDIEVDFDAAAETGTITAVRAETEHLVMSTKPGENADGRPEVLLVQNNAYDRIELGLESPNVGPMTLTLDIVRTASYGPGEDDDTGVVVAGVARVASIGTVTLLCTGW